MSQFHPLLKGAVELHAHCYPSIFPRRQTAWELIADMKAAGMAGVVLKSHEASTTDIATLLREKEPDLHIYGGLVCNYFTGGLSPYAVDIAIRSGAKVIWMPTISADEHLAHFAKKDTRLFNSQKPLVQPNVGLKIWDDQERLLPEVHEILQLIAEADIVLATGHLSAREISALVIAAKKRGIDKILIQHADLGISPLPLALQQDLAKQGAIIEKCYLALSSDFRDLSADQMADTIRRVGPSSCVLVTDYGQAHNMPPVQAFSQFVSEMLDNGISEAAITQMIATNPRKLLNIT